MPTENRSSNTDATNNAPAPYGYLREVDGRCQLSIGPDRPADRAGGHATPWAAVYAGEEIDRLRAESRDLRLHLRGAAFLAERLRKSCLGLRRQALAELLGYLSGYSASVELSARPTFVDLIEDAEAEAKRMVEQEGRAPRQAFPTDLTLRNAVLTLEALSHAAVKPSSTEPSAPVERDEREERTEFEVCIRREWPMAPISRKRDLLPKGDPCYGDYCDEPLQRAWVGWQMRAALERKPA